MRASAVVFAVACLAVGCRTSSGTDVEAGGGSVTPEPVARGSTATSSTSQDAHGSTPDPGIAAKYPGDHGIALDPAIVWVENFEEGSVSAVTSRYDAVSNAPGMRLTNDVPGRSSGRTSLMMTAGGQSSEATDLFKAFSPGYDEWYVRWYAKYQPGGVGWHHTGMWFGGINPATSYPTPQAGVKPNGDERFSVAIEPTYGEAGSARFDFYNYWMRMHSWMDEPAGEEAFYGNALVHQNAFTIDEGKWVCIEVHLRLNQAMNSAQGSALEVWKNDRLVQSFTSAGPQGYWIKDKFCPQGSDGTECTDYPGPDNTVLDLQWRNTASLKLNYIWPQNYITGNGAMGGVQFDDMVVATSRIGCLR